MSLCRKCDKPVYFAERKTSLGTDWHRGCLVCSECGKVLHPGQHAQHKGKPYCHVPCYSALFGPTMFGHGSAIEAHTNFGTQAATKMSGSPLKRPDLEARLRYYNEYYDGMNLQIRSKEVNGRLICEGPLRIHWGVRNPIKLAEKDESPASKEEWRRSYSLAMANGLDESFLQTLDNGGETYRIRRSSIDDLPLSPGPDEECSNGFHTSDSPPSTPPTNGGGDDTFPRPVVVRGNRRKRRPRHKRLSIINGHIFNVDTSIFTPSHDSVTSVTVTTLDTMFDVIKQLLEKYKIENNPRDFCLCIVKGSGETRVLKEQDCPLLERIILGPLEDNARIFIMDDGKVKDIEEEVAHFVNLPDAVLQGFLLKLQTEEYQEEKQIKERYRRRRHIIEDRLSEFTSTHL